MAHISSILGVLLVAQLHASPIPPSTFLFSSADTAFQERANPLRARQALNEYRHIHKKTPLSRDAGWRHAMACQYVGYRVSADPDERADLFREGREAGLASLAIDNDCAPCHFWTAINMALLGQEVGILKMLFTLGNILEHLDNTIRIDPGYAYGGAYRVRGLIYQKLPGILGGSIERARADFEKAVAVANDEPLNYLNLANFFAEQMKLNEEAESYLKQALELPYPSRERVESREAYEEIRAKWNALTKTSRFQAPQEKTRESSRS